MSGPDFWGQRSSFSHASVKNISLLSIHSNHKYKLSLIKSVIPYASNQRSKLSYTSLYLYMSMALSIYTIEFSQKIAMLMCRWYKDLHSDFIFSNNPSLQYGFLALIKFCQFPSTVIFDISVGELFNTTKRLAVVHAIGFVTKMSHFLSDKVFYTFYIM